MQGYGLEVPADICGLAHRPLIVTAIIVAIVSAFIIENHGEVKERFSYEVQFNRATRLSLVAYSQAKYGAEAVFRLMTDAEKADFIAPPFRFPFGQHGLSANHSSRFIFKRFPVGAQKINSE